MLNEKNILININTTVYKFLLSLYETKLGISEINLDIKELDNNYFLEEKDNIYGKLMHLFDEDSVKELIQGLTEFNNLVTKKIENMCQHEWIEDEIDIDLDRSQRICYCKLCEVSKKV